MCLWHLENMCLSQVKICLCAYFFCFLLSSIQLKTISLTYLQNCSWKKIFSFLTYSVTVSLVKETMT